MDHIESISGIIYTFDMNTKLNKIFDKIYEKYEYILTKYFDRWCEIESYSEEWLLECDLPLKGHTTIVKKCYYTILYSQKQNRYKLSLSGYHPKTHFKYKNYEKRLIYLNNMTKLIK